MLPTKAGERAFLCLQSLHKTRKINRKNTTLDVDGLQKSIEENTFNLLNLKPTFEKQTLEL